MQAMFYKGVIRKVDGKECERESRESGVLGRGGGNAIRPSLYTGNTAAELML